MPESVEEIIGRMKEIREVVKADGTKSFENFGLYHELQKSLKVLDPLNPELNIGIHGLQYCAGLKD